MKNQKGFSAIEIIIVVAIVGLLGFGGWYILWHNNKKPNSTSQQAESERPNKQTQADDNVLTIKEWGTKITLGNADASKVTYVLGDATSDTAGSIIATAKLSLVPSVTSDTNCQDLGLVVNRRTVVNATTGGKTVGEYSYDVGGSPFACGDSAIDAIRQQYTGNHPQDWKYQATD